MSIVNNPSIWKRLLLLVLLIVVGGLIFLLVWGANRGFDLTDEGLYLLHLADMLGQGSNSDDPVQFSLIGLRISRLVLTLLSTSFFAWSFYRWLSQRSWFEKQTLTSGVVMLFLLCSSLLSYSIFPQALSYNSLTQILGALFSGLLLLFFAADGDGFSFRKSIVVHAAIGCVVAVFFFVKFPTSLLFFSIYLLAIWALLPRKGSASKLRGIIYALAGFMFIIVIYHFFIREVGEYVTIISTIAENTNEESYGLRHLISGAFADSGRTFYRAVLQHPGLIVLGTGIIALSAWENRFEAKHVKVARLVWALLSAVYIGITVLKFDWYQSGEGHAHNAMLPYVQLLFLIVCALMIPAFRNGLRTWYLANRKEISVAIVLLLILLSSSLGTNNKLSIHLLQYLYLLQALVIVLLAHLYKQAGHWLVPLAFVFLMVAVTSVQTYFGFSVNPYRQSVSLFEQKTSMETRGGERILVDSETANYVTGIRNLVSTETTFQRGDGVINLACQPGITYLLNGHSPGMGWYKLQADKRNCNNLNYNPLRRSDRTVVLKPLGENIPVQFVKCLNAKGIMFPFEYLPVGAVADRIEVWAPRTMIKQSIQDRERATEKQISAQIQAKANPAEIDKPCLSCNEIALRQ